MRKIPNATKVRATVDGIGYRQDSIWVTLRLVRDTPEWSNTPVYECRALNSNTVVVARIPGPHLSPC